MITLYTGSNYGGTSQVLYDKRNDLADNLKGRVASFKVSWALYRHSQIMGKLGSTGYKLREGLFLAKCYIPHITITYCYT